MEHHRRSGAFFLPGIGNHRAIVRIVILFLLIAAAVLVSIRTPARIPPSRAVWEPEISAFEKRDKIDPPPPNAVLFIGSSSIRKWTALGKDFPGVKVINRGFGGSEIDDSTSFAGRIIFPYHPRIMVLYAGDNDLAAGKSPTEVVAEYTNFVSVIHGRLPQTRIVFISIKPSAARWNLRDEIIETNRRIAAIDAAYLSFVDVYSHMLSANGRPRKDLLLSDGLHPDEKCYRLWASLIRPYLN
ncbi:MAG TPA: GDSL-type esterase/lipase family protein [Verrucomicrobiae bacterium]|nr:GDSL-type esterase/lipase family protein [Verrucomicrobiae bacterium]